MQYTGTLGVPYPYVIKGLDSFIYRTIFNVWYKVSNRMIYSKLSRRKVRDICQVQMQSLQYVGMSVIIAQKITVVYYGTIFIFYLETYCTRTVGTVRVVPSWSNGKYNNVLGRSLLYFMYD